MVDNSQITEIFSSFQTYLTEDHEIREEIRVTTRELEQIARNLLTMVQGIHQPDGIKNISAICIKSREMFKSVTEQYSILKSKIPNGHYYRFHDHWRFVSQRLTFIAALIIYLENESLASREQVAELLGVKVKREDGFHIDLDDYLMGLLQVASELSRLAVNAVTAGDYGRPLKLAKFVGELDSGFRLLNLKNDSLRKRFDGLKYDLKKIEEVVYDITIRGLVPKEVTDVAATKEDKPT